MVAANTVQDLLEQMITNKGQRIKDLSCDKPVLLVFLRHFGCTFCREALSDISQRREAIESGGVHLVFVHMTDNETAERYFQSFNLPGATHVSDPDCRFYSGFGLVKGNFTQLFGLQSWIRGFKSGILEGHGFGPMLGDGFQMPGIFVIQDGRIRESFIHRLASDRPDYIKLVECCVLD